jgi:hypothetical protein
MRRIVACIVIVVGLASQAVNAAPRQMLKAAPEQVDLGTFNTFEEKQASAVITNTGSNTFVAASVKANCSCLRARLKDTEIPPGGKTTLEIAALLKADGEFSHDVLIVPKDQERYSPLRVQVKGRALELVVCALACPGKSPVPCDLSISTSLGTVHYKEVTPVLYLAARDNRFDLETAQIDVNSAQFELYDYRWARMSARVAASLHGTPGNRALLLTLRPKKTLTPQRLRDLVEIRIAEKVRLYVPWTCRIVGDVYAQEQRVSLGSLDSGPEKEIRIWFAKGHPRWDRVQWTDGGGLSQALRIEPAPVNPNEHGIRMTVEVDRSQLARLPAGYLFERLTFYENAPTDEEAVSILIDGFNATALRRE